MAVIEWSNSYSLGIDQIDEHHRHLFTLLKVFYEAFVSHAANDEIAGIIDELINYATYHFAAEEVLMKEHGFQQLEEHLAQHETFVKQVLTHQREFAGGRATLSLELIVFLRDWLQGHIMKSDRAFAELIRPRLAEPARGVALSLG